MSNCCKKTQYAIDFAGLGIGIMLGYGFFLPKKTPAKKEEKIEKIEKIEQKAEISSNISGPQEITIGEIIIESAKAASPGIVFVANLIARPTYDVLRYGASFVFQNFVYITFAGTLLSMTVFVWRIMRFLLGFGPTQEIIRTVLSGNLIEGNIEPKIDLNDGLFLKKKVKEIYEETKVDPKRDPKSAKVNEEVNSKLNEFADKLIDILSKKIQPTNPPVFTFSGPGKNIVGFSSAAASTSSLINNNLVSTTTEIIQDIGNVLVQASSSVPLRPIQNALNNGYQIVSNSQSSLVSQFHFNTLNEIMNGEDFEETDYGTVFQVGKLTIETDVIGDILEVSYEVAVAINDYLTERYNANFISENISDPNNNSEEYQKLRKYLQNLLGYINQILIFMEKNPGHLDNSNFLNEDNELQTIIAKIRPLRNIENSPLRATDLGILFATDIQDLSIDEEYSEQVRRIRKGLVILYLILRGSDLKN